VSESSPKLPGNRRFGKLICPPISEQGGEEPLLKGRDLIIWTNNYESIMITIHNYCTSQKKCTWMYF